MKRFIGVKEVLAKPMTRGDYNKYRGWSIPDNENSEDFGYLVEYVGQDNKNHEDHDNYISWCPKDIFEKHNRPSDGMSFGHAIELLKSGKKVAREGWDKNMFLFLREGRQITDVGPGSPMGGDFESLSHVCMRTVDGKCCVGWLASQTDMLSEDWVEVK